MPMTTPPWAPDLMDARDLLKVPRRWPRTTAWVGGITMLYLTVCWTGVVR